MTLQVLYKLKTAKIFEKPKKREESRSENRDSVGDNQKNGSEALDPDPLAVYLIHLCTESRILCFAGATHLVLCRFSKQELNVEVQVNLDIFFLVVKISLPVSYNIFIEPCDILNPGSIFRGMNEKALSYTNSMYSHCPAT